MIKVWRVDDELLTVVETEVDENVAPLNTWLYALMGNGLYCYFTKEDEARAEFKKIVQGQIKYLNSLLAKGSKMDSIMAVAGLVFFFWLALGQCRGRGGEY